MRFSGFQYKGDWLLTEPSPQYHGYGFRVVFPFAVSARTMAGDEVTVELEAGFHTDLESIPWFLRWRFDRLGPGKKAATFHDRLYVEAKWARNGKTERCTRTAADCFYRDLMISDGVKPWNAWLKWVGLRLGGGRPWRRYRR